MATPNNMFEIKGAKETVAALKAWEPEVGKELNKTIRKALNQVKAGAQARYPNGAWSVRINSKSFLGSIRAAGGKGSGRSTSSWADAAPGVKAAIFEFAGSVQDGKTPQARAMIASLNARYGSPGRFLWDAWDAEGPAALETIEAALREAEQRLQDSLDAAGESY